MYVYEKKNNKAKTMAMACFVVLFLFVFMVFVYRENLSEILPVAQEETENARLQLPSINYEEVIGYPYLVNAETLTHYFDSSKTKEVLAQSVVEFDGVWRPSQGVDYGFSGKMFEVCAMLSGEVTDVHDDSLMGKSVTVQSGDLELTYQSLSSVSVNVGDRISQADVLGLAGENYYNQGLGIHLHVVAEMAGNLIDPAALIGRKLSELESTE